MSIKIVDWVILKSVEVGSPIEVTSVSIKSSIDATESMIKKLVEKNEQSKLDLKEVEKLEIKLKKESK